MKKHELQTPAILLDLDKLEHNIQSWQALCNENGKELWPMIKTHKSTALAKMQLDAGATGFLCGTLDECEMVYQLGANASSSYAYPHPQTPSTIPPPAALCQRCRLIIRLDTVRAQNLTAKRKKQVSPFPIPSLWIWISTASGCPQMQLWIS